MDGHALQWRLEPAETRRAQGLCPACGKPLTVGVMHRVEELADRAEGEARGGREDPFRCLVPLPEVLGEIHGAGAKSKAVEAAFERIVARLGPEMEILDRPWKKSCGWTPCWARRSPGARGKVLRDAGYTVSYGGSGVRAGELRGRAWWRPLLSV